MYIEFELNTSAEHIAGYHWPHPAPEYVVCLIHGIGEYAGRYDGPAETFKKSGIATLGFDLRGHGSSAGKRGHCAPRSEVLADADALLMYAESQYPGKPLILYGHSLGGNIALDYRVRGRFAGKPRAYIASSPWLGLTRKIPKPLYLAAKAMARIKPDFTFSANIKPEYLGNPEIIRAEKRPDLVHGSISAQAAAEGIDIGKALETGALRGGAGAEKPILIMHGDSDKICSVESTRKFAALEKGDCTYIEWKDFFHELHNGNAEKDGTEPVRAITDWIKSLPALSD